MAFNKTDWNEGAAPGISAEELNRIEQGVADAHVLPHSATTGRTADDHHSKVHGIGGADHTGSITNAQHGTRSNANAHAHSHLSGVSANQHHAENHKARHQVGGADLLDGDLNANARVGVRKGIGTTFKRRRLSLIEGAGIVLTVADDSGSEEVDVTIAQKLPTYQWVVVTGESGSGGTEVAIATLTIPLNEPYDRMVIPSAHHNLSNSGTDNPDWTMRIRKDNVSGEILGVARNRHIGANHRLNYAIAAGKTFVIPTGLANAKLVLTLQRNLGGGVLEAFADGGLAALVIPA